MSIDPVCGMSVDPEANIATTHAGIEYRFCSEPCRARFAANPQQFATAQVQHAQHARQPGGRFQASMIVVVLFVSLALILWLASSRGVGAGALPILLLLACPFLHLLLHRRHGHDHRSRST